MFRPPNVPERIQQVVPDARLIAVLRSPTNRAVASWKAFRDLGQEPRSLLEAVSEEIDALGGENANRPPDPREVLSGETDPAHVHKGRYADQLERWYETFPRTQMHVVVSDELFSDTQTVFDKTVSFLGLNPHRVDQLEPGSTSSVGDTTEARSRLDSYYSQPNRNLNDLLGHKLPWSD